tara:strand:+ start:1195 stop:1929 length:735 start_codon:yes stop_codon:yes gene_type:complete
MSRIPKVLQWIFCMLFFSSPHLVFAESNKTGYVLVKKITLEGNLILDDTDLEKSLDLGKTGIFLTPDLFPLIKEEVEGFYSSLGFHRVRASISIPKSRKGILTLKVNEEREIREAQSDVRRAEVALDRLVSRNMLEPEKSSRENALATLVEAYRLKRSGDFEAEKKRLKEEKTLAKISRDRYLMVLYQKRKTEAENLKLRRANLMNIFTGQEKFIEEQKQEKAELLTEMRRRMRAILDIRFNGG